MSSNCNLRRRKPALAELARLLATVSMCACWSLMPLAAVYNARIMVSPWWRLDARELFSRGLVKVVVEYAERLLHHLGLALDEDELHSAVDSVLIGILECSLLNRSSGGKGLLSVGGEAVGP